MTLYDKYGYCLLSQNTYLYRTGEIDKNVNSLFFFLTYSDASGFHPRNRQVQIWKTKKDIKLLFMVREINRFGHAKSAIVEIFNYYFPGVDAGDDVAIKQNIKTRMRLIDKMKTDGFVGWLSSVENKYVLEICLFDTNNISYIELLQSVDQADIKNNQHTLKYIDIHPSIEFYDKSYLKIGTNSYDEYKNMIDEDVENECSSRVDRNTVKNSYYNLRMKLKI